jgi:mercuric ion binding protein
MKKFLLTLSVVLAVFTLSFADQIFKVKIEGMTCKMCVIAIKKSLKDIKGVKKVNISLKNGSAVIETKDNVKSEEILKAIQKAGMYKGTILKVEKK